MRLVHAASGFEYSCDPGRITTVGRSPDCDLVINDARVSRQHATLRCLGGDWWFADAGSSNGSAINGRSAKRARVVTVGDVLTVGATDLVLLDKSESAVITELPQHSHATTLSTRERQVLELLADGLTDAQIAGQLVLSPKTIESHLDRIRDKTGARRRAELTRFALSSRMVTAPNQVTELPAAS